MSSDYCLASSMRGASRQITDKLLATLFREQIWIILRPCVRIERLEKTTNHGTDA